ncbi:nuclear transport factor 2 family protein [[Mycobacterium] nativiensis]|uniref:Nuclear transport factor 2 family protein n=1 Tax=[Mycobacterium] nativiensis TaxID=2855503 RepID=A0ABU5XQW4_9MYCO|nr:nuclear transport factor 2 family protein [Mycolicibacter sp. MYC340]MEB3030318.1 nuclear transport factor 2 family protein [Mycolicibacter sp. MYC340]
MSTQTSTAAADTIRRYVALLESGSADDLVALFAENATVEDPVGGEVRHGRESIHAFFTTLENLERHTELTLVRVVEDEAAFAFTITFTAGDTQLRLQPIDTVVFNANGEISSLRSYFASSDMTPV